MRRLVSVGAAASAPDRGRYATVAEVEARALALASRPRLFGGGADVAVQMLRIELDHQLSSEAKPQECVSLFLILRDLERELGEDANAYQHNEEARMLLPLIPEGVSVEEDLRLSRMTFSVAAFIANHAALTFDDGACAITLMRDAARLARKHEHVALALEIESECGKRRNYVRNVYE